MSNIWLIWLFLGMNFMVNEWIRVGMLESTYQNTISAKINTEGSMSLLLIFEACFFAGVYWIYKCIVFYLYFLWCLKLTYLLVLWSSRRDLV